MHACLTGERDSCTAVHVELTNSPSSTSTEHCHRGANRKMAMDMADIGSELEITVDLYPPQGTRQDSMDPEDMSQWMPGYSEAYSSPAMYVMQDSTAALDELTCAEFEYGNTDSDSESDDVLSVTGEDNGDPSVRVTPESGLLAGLVLPQILSTTTRPLSNPRRNGSLSPGSREEKNNRERVRIIRKREKLKEAKDMAIRSALIDEDAKKHRWTEEYTLKQIRKMIATLEGQFKQCGRSPRTPRPLARKAAPRGCRRPPNSFLRFSQALRPSFLGILKVYLHPEKKKGELEHIQVDNREVTKFLSAVWRSLGPEEKRRDWSTLGLEPFEKRRFMRLAEEILHQNMPRAHL